MSAVQWWILTLGVGLLAGFLGVLVVLPPADAPEHRTGVRQDWPDGVALDDTVSVRVTFVTTDIQPGPNVTFELHPDQLQGVVFETTRPTVAPVLLEDGTIIVQVPSDPVSSRGEYQTELRFRPTQVGAYSIPVRYRIGDGLPSAFVATGQVTPSRRGGVQEPVHAWE